MYAPESPVPVDAVDPLERSFRAMVDASRAPMALMSARSGRYLHGNPQAVQLVGAGSLSAFVHREAHAYSVPVQPDGQSSDASAKAHMEHALVHGSACFEWLHRRKDGETWWGQVHLAHIPVRHDDLFFVTFIDITPRKRRQERQEVLQAWLSGIFEASEGVSIIATDPDGRITVFNAGAERILGYTADELIGRHSPAVFHDPVEVAARATALTAELGEPIEGFETFVALSKRGQTDTQEWTYVRKDGGRLRVRLTVTVVRAPNGAVLGFLGTAVDVTELRAAQAKLGEAAERYRALFDSSDDALLLLDDGRFVECNPKVLQVFQCEASDILGLSPADYSPAWQPDGRLSAEAARRHLQGALAGQVQRFEWVHHRQDGTPFHADVALTPMKLEGRTVVQASIRDISEQKQAVNELREREEALRRLFEDSSDAILLIRDQRYIDGNAAAMAMLGLSHKEQILFLHPWDLSPETQPDGQPSQRAFLSMIERAERHNHVRFEWLHLDRDDREILVDVTMTRLMILGEPVLHLTCRDITERRRAREQLLHVQKMEAVGQLSGGIAHDFNNTLVGIMGSAELLHLELPEDSPLHELVDTILDGGSRAAELTRRLLTFSRKARIVATPLSLHACIRAALELFTRSVGPRVRVNTRLDARLDVVSGDRALLQSAILNLALNARDAMPDGGDLWVRTQDICLQTSDGVLTPGQYIQVEVADAGTGMNAEVMARVFEPFFTTKATGKGTGLGLAAVFSTMKDHRGAITVASQPGSGSVFTLRLPVDPRPLGPDEVSTVVPPRSRTGTVVVIDDEPRVRDVAEALLGVLGYQVRLAGSGQDGLDLLDHVDDVKLVILDLVMPGLSGQQTFDAIRRLRPEVPIVLCSGYDPDGAAEVLLEQPQVSFLAKPYRLDRLTAAVDQVLPAESSSRES